MILKEARKQGIEYCEANKCNYTLISYDDSNKFQLNDKEGSHTVFFLNKNGSLKPYVGTSYAVEFHKELKRRRKARRNNDKRIIADIANGDCKF